jgi:hypothetical protein
VGFIGFDFATELAAVVIVWHRQVLTFSNGDKSFSFSAYSPDVESPRDIKFQRPARYVNGLIRLESNLFRRF